MGMFGRGSRWGRGGGSAVVAAIALLATGCGPGQPAAPAPSAATPAAAASPTTGGSGTGGEGVLASPERAYWHHGYQAALDDIIDLFNPVARKSGSADIPN